MSSIRLKFDAPRWISLVLALGGLVWAVFLSVITVLSLFDVTMWGGAAYFLCGYAVFFWWIYRWRRIPSLRTAVIWWLGSFVVNALFFCIRGLPFHDTSNRGLDWAIIGWWGFASAASLTAVVFEILLERRVHNAS